jgi:structural maintenance of chromosome 1
MGKLLQLELFNFKSYKGHHVMQFGDSYFTSIIGPNGSGKSNSMDAISFVLGIKSSHLRSTHLRDLVYRGRVLKNNKIDANGDVVEDEGEGQANDAAELEDEDDDEDTQTSTQRNDPQTAWVMAVYEDDAGEEQRWKRSITSSGQSEYRINNRLVQAKAYNDALEAENILIKARNFLVFQGDVEAVASQSPRDLTRLLEQISGSLEYSKEYDRLKAVADKAETTQREKMDLRRGITTEIKAYQQQKDELDSYEQKRTEKDQAVVTSVLFKLYHFQRTIEDSTAEIQRHQEELKEFRRNVQKYENQLAKAQQDQAKVGRDVSKIERDVKRKEKNIEEKENALVPIDEKLSISNKKLHTYERQIEEIRKERQSQQAQADKLRKDLSGTEKAQERWQTEWTAQQQQTGRALSAEDMEEYQVLRGEVYKRSGEDQVNADNTTRDIKTNEETVASLKSNVDRAQSNIDTLQADINSLQERRSERSQQVKATKKELSAKQVLINNLNSERTRTRQKAKELEEKLQQALMKLTEGQSQQRESKKEQRQRETVAQMKRIFPGVKGMVHQLVRPKQKKYETALPIVLGRWWDAVVTDSEKTAKDCIDYLKSQRFGTMAFVPLDTIVHKQPNANYRSLSRGARLAVDAVEFDSSLERAVSFACGDALICDEWNIARDLKWGRKIDVKMVTLDGRSVTKGNLISGGDTGERKRRWEDAEIENVRTLVEKLKSDLDALPNDHKRQIEEEALQSELSGLQQKLQYAQDELTALDSNISSKSRELQHFQKQLSQDQPKYNDEARGLEALRQQLESYTASIAEVEDEIFGDFCQRLGYANIRDYERQQGSLQQESSEKEMAFKTQISRLSNQLKYEEDRLRNTDARIKTISNASQRDRDLIATLDEAKEVIGGELDVLNAEIEQLSEQLTELKVEYDQRGERVNEARAELKKRSKNVSKTIDAVSGLEAEVTRATSDRYGILRMCKVENIDLPLERGSRKLDSLPLEEAILEDEGQDAMDIDGEDLSQRAPKINDYGIHPSFEDLEEDLTEAYSQDLEDMLAEKITSIQSELDKMAPNMRSADRLEQTSEKLQAVDREFNDSRKSYRKAQQEFQKVQQRRMELFNKAFNHIKDQIAPVYKDLTKSSSWPLGGQAYLDVEEEDEPYLSGVKYHATPPGKRFRDMEHLSGGEKTMAALALLFAIHTYAPSPFFVLDEVDAALDVANTMRLANYVREKAGPGMQFVVISLKAGLFQESETLVGVMRDQGVNSSRALTLDVSDPDSDIQQRWNMFADYACSCENTRPPRPFRLLQQISRFAHLQSRISRKHREASQGRREHNWQFFEEPLLKMAGYAQGEAKSRLVASLVYDIHNMFKFLHPCCLFIALLTKSCDCGFLSYVTSPKYQRSVVTRIGRRRLIERPSQDVRRASPRRHPVRLDTSWNRRKRFGIRDIITLTLPFGYSRSRDPRSQTCRRTKTHYRQFFVATTHCIMQCYITTEKLHLQHNSHPSQTEQWRLQAKTPNLSQHSKNHTNFRVARKREAWRCHLATPPSFKNP